MLFVNIESWDFFWAIDNVSMHLRWKGLYVGKYCTKCKVVKVVNNKKGPLCVFFAGMLYWL